MLPGDASSLVWTNRRANRRFPSSPLSKRTNL